MFKTITAYVIADKPTLAFLNPSSLANHIDEPTVVDPDKTQWGAIGFSKPDYFGDDTVFVGADDTRMFNLQLRERVLPGKVIKTHLAERTTDAARRQGHMCTRKQVAELKEEVIASLLPTAFIKPTDILCMITRNYLIVGTGSARLVDLAIETLRAAYPDDTLNFHSIGRELAIDAWMLDLLLEGTTASGIFHVGESVVLKGRNKSAARYKDVELASKAVRDSVEDGMRPVEMAVEYNERIHFALTDQLLIKRIKFSDLLLKQAEEEGEGEIGVFDATVALVSGELRELLDTLRSEIPAVTKVNEEDEL